MDVYMKIIWMCMIKLQFFLDKMVKFMLSVLFIYNIDSNVEYVTEREYKDYINVERVMHD